MIKNNKEISNTRHKRGLKNAARKKKREAEMYERLRMIYHAIKTKGIKLDFDKLNIDSMGRPTHDRRTKKMIDILVSWENAKV